MRILYDPDEYETVYESSPCTACGGDMRKCNGGCNGSGSLTTRRRRPAEVALIKAKRRKEHENAVLAEAAAIRQRRETDHA